MPALAIAMRSVIISRTSKSAGSADTDRIAHGLAVAEHVIKRGSR